MSGTATLARYGAELCYDDLPADVIRRATDCLIDTVAATIFSRQLPWAGALFNVARGRGEGPASLFGIEGSAVTAEAAALVNGSLAHGFEMDSLRKPGLGVHPGAVLVPAALALAQETGASGRDVIAAIVAGCEVMFRVGAATRQSIEEKGFHAPGVTGPFGSTVVAGRLLGLDVQGMQGAMGLAGSLAGGLMQFARSRDGILVKRLHLGRASENGILAARLAAGGFWGPGDIIEGEYGVLASYAEHIDPHALTEGIGNDYQTRTICLKRYPCHIMAHAPVTAILEMRDEGLIKANDISSVTVLGTAKMVRLHANQTPGDLGSGQYSVPFCVAVALLTDPRDPLSFANVDLQDPVLRDLVSRIEVHEGSAEATRHWATTVTVKTKAGQVIERTVRDFPGAPAMPLSQEQLREKFLRATRSMGDGAGALFERLNAIETIGDMRECSLA